jgi:hypothetical protein
VWFPRSQVDLFDPKCRNLLVDTQPISGIFLAILFGTGHHEEKTRPSTASKRDDFD